MLATMNKTHCILRYEQLCIEGTVKGEIRGITPDDESDMLDQVCAVQMLKRPPVPSSLQHWVLQLSVLPSALALTSPACKPSFGRVCIQSLCEPHPTGQC